MSDVKTEPRSRDAVPGPEPGGPPVSRILFVCTGNTCRSPMAEAIARERLRARGWDDVEVRSAGAGAFPGSSPSDGALRVAGRRGVSLEGHKAALLTRREVEWAELILTMSPSHLVRVSELGGGGHASLLTAYAEGLEVAAGAGAIPDPIGGSDEEYAETYERLEGLIDKVLDRLGAGAGR